MEEINICLQESKKRKSIKQVKEIVQNLKTEIEAMKKTQNKRIFEMENLGKQTGTTGASVTNRIQ